ncbi:Transcription factor GRAS [Corchorus capsularis]|uniref:Transcription factor GRAS n=1 Tax=Corchorus capsularis TaxID=210143 RepID=A0A1R3GQH1_COCAP|nr:Transcription factor GRAS [Corchorus capsularis]
MEPGLQWQPELFDDGQSNEVMGLDLNLPGFQISPLSCPIYRDWPIFVETRNHKRLKLEDSTDESIGRNSSKTSLPKLQFRDHIWAYTQRYLAIEAMEEATVNALAGTEQENEIKAEEGTGVGEEMKLVQQLISCAEAVACRDKIHASALLSELRANALVFGTSFQRVASCFVQGLADRLALVQPLGAVGVIGLTAKAMAVSLEKDEALSLVYELCPQIQFGHFVANASILEAFEGESFVHVVDLGMTLGLSRGHQWLNLMKGLVHRSGQPPKRLRITGVGTCPERLQAIGDDLEQFMEALHYYSAIFDSLDTMLPKYDTRRAKMEQFYFAEEIKNIVSCEGPARIERHERVDQWRRRMSRAGFQPAPIKMVMQAKKWLGKFKVCEGYTIVEDKGCLVLGWKSKPIIAASCWK